MEQEFINRILHIFDRNSLKNWIAECEEKIVKSGNQRSPSRPNIKTQYDIKISCKNEKRLYLDTLYNIKHRIGRDTGANAGIPREKLYEFCQRAFRIEPEAHSQLMAKTESEKPPTIILNVGLIEAKNLEPKDINGFSDPYCMLGVIPGENLGNMMDMQRLSLNPYVETLPFKNGTPQGTNPQGIAITDVPVNFLHVSSVKYKTLDPVWNENFKCIVQDIETDKFHLDLWDHDDDFSVLDAAKKLNNVHGLKGVNRYFKQIVQSARCNDNNQNIDDFLGCVTIDLKSLSSTVSEKWYELLGRTSKSKVQGSVKLKLFLSTVEDNDDRNELIEINVKEIDQQIELCKLFIAHELYHLPAFIKVEDWNGDLPTEANYILHQHAVQGDVNDVQQIICKWIALTDIFCDNNVPFNYNVFNRIIQNLEYMASNDNNYKMSLEEVNMVSESFIAFIKHVMDTFINMDQYYPLITPKESLKRLENNLNLLATIYSLNVFQTCCPFINDLPMEIRIVLKKGIQSKYDGFKEKLKHKLEDENIHYLTSLGDLVNFELYKMHYCYRDPFKNTIDFNILHATGKLYSHLYFQDVTKLLNHPQHEDCKFKVQDVLKELDMRTSSDNIIVTGSRRKTFTITDNENFDLYCRIRNMCDCSELKCKIYMIYWFLLFYEKWLDVTQLQIIKNLKTHVENDKFTVEEDSANPEHETKDSSGAMLIAYLESLLSIWDQIDVLKQEITYYFVKKHYEIITQAMIFYADLIIIRGNEIFNDHKVDNGVMLPSCTMINNLTILQEHMNKFTNGFKESLDDVYLKEFLKIRDSVAVIKSLETKRDALIENLAHNIYESCLPSDSSCSELTDEQVIKDILFKLNQYFCDLKRYLGKDEFYKCIEEIYNKLIKDFSIAFQKLGDKSRAKVIYENLKIILGFFNANGQGLTYEILENDKYKTIANKLVWHQMDTKDLIDLALILKLEKQMTTTDTTKYGILTLKAYYNEPESTLHVKVICAQDLLAMDAGGTSDPFVEINLLPSYLFGKRSGTKKKTKTIKKSLNPFFNEDFTISAPSQKCFHVSSMIKFSVLDQDIMGIDYIGEAYLSFRDIPGTSGKGDNPKTLDQVTPIHLQLIKIHSSARIGPELVLEERIKFDNLAKEYFL